MTFRGKLENGIVILTGACKLPKGTIVRINPIRSRKSARKNAKGRKRAKKTLSESLVSWAGRAKDMPSDLARNHDRYLFGTPKR